VSKSVGAPPGPIALIGNPNTGKTSLFNRLCGLRAHVANHPGITADARVGSSRMGGRERSYIDLPGLYSLELDLPESRLGRKVLEPPVDPSSPESLPRPSAVVVVVDASNLARNLTLAAETIERGLPLVVVLSMGDVAERRGVQVDADALAEHLGVPVVPANPRRGEGVEAIVSALDHATLGRAPESGESREEWATRTATAVTRREREEEDHGTDRLDRILTHPIGGVVVFLAVMAGLFSTIFWLAGYPMTWIEEVFALLGGGVTDLLPEGVLRDLLVDGVVGGIAGTVVFLPQICLLFFLLTLIEDTGYLARASFVANRLLRPFGLPGTAFVPLLSSHACAIPGIICTRLIPDRRDRLATILVAPFVSCSARIPVYTLLIGVLFAGRPAWQGGLAFAGCYLLGGVAALLTALLFRRTLLRGRSRPMLLELPPYRRPSLRNAALTAWDRGRTFLVKAGTVILLISIVLWWMSTYPGTPTSPEVLELRTRAEAAADATAAEQLAAQADRLEGRESLAGSYSGRIGRTVEPILSPIGADWQLSIAVLSSFAAREVFVSALTVTLGAGDDIDDSGRVREIVASARRDDGSPLLDPAAAASLLVFFVLAMQCLPTLAVTSREAGGWRWAALQFGYMSVVAWFLAWLTHGIVGGGA
jgi:ferrous iron transport protein B